jgi:DNA replication protein DnaC
VDELGYLPLEPDAAHLFFQLVSRRYEKGAMLVTSNRNISEWGTVFGDAIVATVSGQRRSRMIGVSSSCRQGVNSGCRLIQWPLNT